MVWSDKHSYTLLDLGKQFVRKPGHFAVAEDVEAELVHSLGCEQEQRYLIAKPTPLDDLLA